MRYRVSLFFFLLSTVSALGQQQQYKIGLIGFYNFENLFDTLDDASIMDEEFTPSGAKLYNTAIYTEKLANLARVITEMGADLSPDGLSILGVAEIENRKVLEDFAAQPALKDRNYQIVHYDSPDERGIDVALLYQPKYFQVTDSRAIPLLIYDADGAPQLTRDILLVSGTYDGEPLHFFVNHWPSRRGGEAATQAYRNAAALTCKNVCDSIYQAQPNAKIIIMGDLNDDPISPSVAKVLNARAESKDVRKNGFFNPLTTYYRRGLGTLAYQDSWNLFDQLIISHGLLNDKKGYHFHQAHIFKPPYLVQASGRYKGYPLRTFSGDTFLHGYSDHFPVYLALVKPVDR